jgi:hypothetical protein
MEKQPEQYKPSEEEVEKAEEMITDEEKNQSEFREEILVNESLGDKAVYGLHSTQIEKLDKSLEMIDKHNDLRFISGVESHGEGEAVEIYRFESPVINGGTLENTIKGNVEYIEYLYIESSDYQNNDYWDRPEAYDELKWRIDERVFVFYYKSKDKIDKLETKEQERKGVFVDKDKIILTKTDSKEVKKIFEDFFREK